MSYVDPLALYECPLAMMLTMFLPHVDERNCRALSATCVRSACQSAYAACTSASATMI